MVMVVITFVSGVFFLFTGAGFVCGLGYMMGFWLNLSGSLFGDTTWLAEVIMVVWFKLFVHFDFIGDMFISSYIFMGYPQIPWVGILLRTVGIDCSALIYYAFFRWAFSKAMTSDFVINYHWLSIFLNVISNLVGFVMVLISLFTTFVLGSLLQSISSPPGCS